MKSTNNFPKMHVSLYVDDINQSVQFYNEFFNQSADKVKPGYAKYILDEPALVISFVENSKKTEPLFGHLGFQVDSKDRMLKEHSRLKTLGYKTIEESETACCYAIQDKFWVSDPDGHRWEVYYFHADVEFNDPQYTSAGEEVCCSESMMTKEAISKSKEETEACCEPGAGCC
jgi:catechol 2,3-dioxygenase-like lactoylglutathione lyase family enzyme